MLVSDTFDPGAKSLAPQIQMLSTRFAVLVFEDFKHETQLVSYIFLSTRCLLCCQGSEENDTGSCGFTVTQTSGSLGPCVWKLEATLSDAGCLPSSSLGF